MVRSHSNRIRGSIIAAAIAAVALLAFATAAHATIATKSAPTAAAARYGAQPSTGVALAHRAAAQAKPLESAPIRRHYETVATKSAPTAAASSYQARMAPASYPLVGGQVSVVAHRGIITALTGATAAGLMVAVAAVIAIAALLSWASRFPRPAETSRDRGSARGSGHRSAVA